MHFLLCLLPTVFGGLHVAKYSNAALHGPAVSNSTVASLDFSIDDFVGHSAEVSGRLAIAEEAYYAFDCAFDGGQIVIAWLDDHLLRHAPHRPHSSYALQRQQYQLVSRRGWQPVTRVSGFGFSVQSSGMN